VKKHGNADVANQRKTPDDRTAVPEEHESLSPEMRRLILSFDAAASSKRPRARDARGRFVSSR
jgi:NADPH-dependent ferric siderophore reductase